MPEQTYETFELDLYPIDYPLETLVERIKDKKIILNPDFQRIYRWDQKGHKRGSKFIESCLMRIPINSCYFAEDDLKNHKVIDGVQRLTTIQKFFNDEFALEGLDFYKNIEGKKFSELETDMQNDLKNYTIRCVILRKKNDERMVREIFARLNQGAMILHDQEIRHALYSGSLDNLLKELADTKKGILKKLHGGKQEEVDERSAIFRQEYVLRYFALNGDLSDYNDIQKEYLDSYMENMRNIDSENTEKMRIKFNKAIENCKTVFGEERIFVNPLNRVNKSSVVYYDLLMHSLGEKTTDFIERNKEGIRKLFAELCNDPVFKKAANSATQQKTNILKRRRMWDEKLNTLV